VTDSPLLPTPFKVTLNSSGNGSVRVGPGIPRQTWFINLLSVTVSTNVAEPVAKVWFGNAGSAFLGGTYTGANDVFGPDILLANGQYLTVVWTGGDANAIATCTVSGTIRS
jgi:hypothetical protein